MKHSSHLIGATPPEQVRTRDTDGKERSQPKRPQPCLLMHSAEQETAQSREQVLSKWSRARKMP